MLTRLGIALLWCRGRSHAAPVRYRMATTAFVTPLSRRRTSAYRRGDRSVKATTVSRFRVPAAAMGTNRAVVCHHFRVPAAAIGTNRVEA